MPSSSDSFSDPVLDGPAILPPGTPRRGTGGLMDLYSQGEVGINPRTDQPDLFGTMGDPSVDYNLPQRLLLPLDRPPAHPNEMEGWQLQQLMNELLNSPKVRQL